MTTLSLILAIPLALLIAGERVLHWHSNRRRIAWRIAQLGLPGVSRRRPNFGRRS